MADGLQQRGVSGVIQAGVGLVKHHKNGVTIKRTGQGYALALSPREDGPVSPYRTFIALWQGFDERIEAHQAGCRFYTHTVF